MSSDFSHVNPFAQLLVQGIASGRRKSANAPDAEPLFALLNAAPGVLSGPMSSSVPNALPAYTGSGATSPKAFRRNTSGGPRRVKKFPESPVNACTASPSASGTPPSGQPEACRQIAPCESSPSGPIDGMSGPAQLSPNRM